MRHSRGARLSALLALGAVTAVVLVAAASGGQAFRETVHFEETFELDDFCDVQGLTVEIDRVVDIRIHVVPHGPEGLAYFVQHGLWTEVLTANGTSLTSVAIVNEKDKTITDNGDGTLNIVILTTGNAVVYGANGKAIARNPGQLRFEIVVDDGGTPDDFSDDTVTRLGNVKGSTGRSDDFCEAMVPALS